VLWESPCSTEMRANLRFDGVGLVEASGEGPCPELAKGACPELVEGVTSGTGEAEADDTTRAAQAVANSTTATDKTTRSDHRMEGVIHIPHGIRYWTLAIVSHLSAQLLKRLRSGHNNWPLRMNLLLGVAHIGPSCHPYHTISRRCSQRVCRRLWKNSFRAVV
jgi:hypothetical protein